MKKAPPAAKKKPAKVRQPTNKQRDSDDIERAVYDGMQDLRVKKKPGRS